MAMAVTTVSRIRLKMHLTLDVLREPVSLQELTYFHKFFFFLSFLMSICALEPELLSRSGNQKACNLPSSAACWQHRDSTRSATTRYSKQWITSASYYFDPEFTTESWCNTVYVASFFPFIELWKHDNTEALPLEKKNTRNFQPYFASVGRKQAKNGEESFWSGPACGTILTSSLFLAEIFSIRRSWRTKTCSKWPLHWSHWVQTSSVVLEGLSRIDLITFENWNLKCGS